MKSLSEMSTIKNVIIKPGCITCGLCAFVAPEVFEVTDISHVKEGVDTILFQAAIKEAIEQCPVQVIVCENNEVY